MSESVVVGLTPALPRPLSGWRWWTEPVRAERLSALRIGVAVALLWDILFTYLPQADTFFGAGSLGSPEVFTSPWHWSALRWTDNPEILRGALIVWAVAALFLLAGWQPQLSAAFCWVMSISVMNLNFYLRNSGDNVRTIALFYLMLTPCGAVWVLGRKRNNSKIHVAPWAVCLLTVQLGIIYLLNGMSKLAGPDWRSGDVMHSVLSDLAWTRISYDQVPIPYWGTQLMTWTVMIWESTFPLFIMMPWMRPAVLWSGVLFHLGTAAFLQLGPFPFYMMCLYLPLVPWEKYVDRRHQRGSALGENGLAGAEPLNTSPSPA